MFGSLNWISFDCVVQRHSLAGVSWVHSMGGQVSIIDYLLIDVNKAAAPKLANDNAVLACVLFPIISLLFFFLLISLIEPVVQLIEEGAMLHRTWFLAY